MSRTREENARDLQREEVDRSFYGEPYIVDEVYTDNKDAPVRCASCDWTGPVSATLEIERCALTIGDPSPAGRCPDEDCRACCYLEEDPLTAASKDLLAALKIAVRYMPSDNSEGTERATVEAAIRKAEGQ